MKYFLFFPPSKNVKTIFSLQANTGGGLSVWPEGHSLPLLDVNHSVIRKSEFSVVEK